MKDGGNVAQKARMICPFFVRFTLERRAIVCEGMTRGVQTATMFRRREDMERYSEKYCETFRYGRCSVAMGVSLKIAEAEEKKDS